MSSKVIGVLVGLHERFSIGFLECFRRSTRGALETTQALLKGTKAAERGLESRSIS